jgi:uncharacterized protein (TIGR02145 family)
MKIVKFVSVFFLPFVMISFVVLERGESTRPSRRFTSIAPKSIRIGTQEWTTENLDVSKFRNGEPIMEADTYEAWEKACVDGTPVWCYYKNEPVKYKSMGKLYNFWAVADKRQLAPEGWHVPKDEEWAVLAKELGGVDLAGKSMKTRNGWIGDEDGDNKSGFTAIAAGYRSHQRPAYYGGPFFEAGEAAYWWSTTRYLVDNSFCRTLSSRNSRLEKNSFVMTAGLSVRLVKN